MGWLDRIFTSGSGDSDPSVEPDEDLDSSAAEALRSVIDPEIGINIVDLGLVYQLRTEGGVLKAEIGLTSPSCPLGDYIAAQARDRLAEVAGNLALVQVVLNRNVRWSPDRMSAAARRALGRG